MSRPPASTRSRMLALAAMLPALGGEARAEPACPVPLAEASRLVLVTTQGMDRVSARLQRFERAGPGQPWQALGPPERAVVGRSGLAWGHGFRGSAQDGEPVKREGDGRTPAGLYRLGRGFGYPATARPGNLVLRPGASLCVDDPASPDYNRIVPLKAGLKGEDMGAEPLYRRGLVIDYPSDAAARAGSCIFLHVWRSRSQGTAGCVALPEHRVAALQGFATEGAVIAILPDAARARFPGCLP